MLAACHLVQVAFRISPARLDDRPYVFARQNCRDTFCELVFNVFLKSFFHGGRRRQPPFMSQPARFIGRPAAVEYGGLAFADPAQLINPVQGGIACSREIISHKNLQRVLASNPRGKPPTRTHNQGWNSRSLSRSLGYAPEKQSPCETVTYCANDDESPSCFCCSSCQLVKRRTRKKFFFDLSSQVAQALRFII